MPLLLVLLLCAPAFAAGKAARGLRYPSLTPDGRQVVFGYRGDIWVAPTDGSGPARRLTLHEAQDTVPRVSPDGKQIAFSSRRHGGYDLFVIPITGGEPKQITFHSGTEILCDWSPDGRRLLFLSARAMGEGGLDLYEADVAGGTPRRITFDGGRDGAYAPDGKTVVYARGFNDIYCDNYAGSANYDIYLTDLEGGLPRRLTHSNGNERWPYFSADARTVYFLAEEKGVKNFYAMPVAGGDRRIVTKYTKDDVHRPDLNWDGKTAVYERVGQLYIVDLTKPSDKPTPIKVDIQSDVRNSGIERRTIRGGGEQVDIDRTGQQVAFALRGDIWIMPASGGNGRRVTQGPWIDQWPRFSPDGKMLAFFSNRRGNDDIYLLNLANGLTRQITKNAAGDFYHTWAPDGRSLVFSSERSGNRDLWRIEVDTGMLTQLTKHPAPDDDPSYSPDGKMIAFDSGRDGGQAIFVMNADGKNQRRVTPATGFLQVPSFSPDSRMIVYESFVQGSGGSGGLYVIRTSGGASVQISQDGQTARWSQKGDYIYFHANRGPAAEGIYRVRAPESIEPGEMVPFVGEVEVDLRRELGNLFDEAWGRLRDTFYDAKMHGVNWNAMRGKYRDMAIDAENKAEFQNVIRQMLAELGASHLGIYGGNGNGRGVTPKVSETGLLGLEFASHPDKDGTLEILAILPGGPADKIGLRVGDRVTKIGNKPVAAKGKGKPVNLDITLRGTVGKNVPIHFRPKTPSGLGEERARSITPVARMVLYETRYRHWLTTCQKRVKEATAGKARIGYIHLKQMNAENLLKFQQAVMGSRRGRRRRRPATRSGSLPAGPACPRARPDRTSAACPAETVRTAGRPPCWFGPGRRLPRRSDPDDGPGPGRRCPVCRTCVSGRPGHGRAASRPRYGRPARAGPPACPPPAGGCPRKVRTAAQPCRFPFDSSAPFRSGPAAVPETGSRTRNRASTTAASPGSTRAESACSPNTSQDTSTASGIFRSFAAARNAVPARAAPRFHNAKPSAVGTSPR